MLAGVETAPAFPPLTSGPQHFTVPEVSNFPGLRPAVPKEGNERILRSKLQEPDTGRPHRLLF